MIWCGIVIGLLLGSCITLAIVINYIKPDKKEYLDDFEKMADEYIKERNGL